ncbi:MAG TPA: acyl-CoA dehydrogenase [Candidatus Entotheonella sp.]|jgi:alkylation response protein AidB-like acyl-CoA dehydrogenase
MDLKFSAEDEAYRLKLRSWLEDNMPSEPPPHGQDAAFAYRRDWQRKLYDGGWVGIQWPKEYGGQGATLIQQAIYAQETARARAPQPANGLGISIVGPTLIHHGTEEQKKRYIPKILNADEIWCQGFSEPNSGSDLASLQTKAVLDGDAFVVNGQKIWTSLGQYADWCILLVRTDPDAPKHRGITFLLVDMHTPGITVRPLKQITGHAEFNETFFDNVRVPRENVVGEINEGWRIAMTTLTYERGISTLSTQVRMQQNLEAMCDYARKTRRNGHTVSEDPIYRQQLAEAHIRVEIMLLNLYRGITAQLRGQPPGPESSLAKLYWSELDKWMQELGMSLQGPYSQLDWDSDYAVPGDWQYNFLRSRAGTIYSGTSEIQRNIIGERVLGLPKG